MDIAGWIKAARTHAGISQGKLALALGFTKANVSAWENGRHRPKLEQWLEIQRYTLYPPPIEMFGSGIAPSEAGICRVPLISYVQAGAWTGSVAPFDPEAAQEWLLTDLALSRSVFALEIRGDSMLPEFRPGDRVIIDPELMPQPGDFVAAKNCNEDATFKKYRPRGMDAAGNLVFELAPLNEDYPAIRSDTQPVRIIGTMVEHRKYRRRT